MSWFYSQKMPPQGTALVIHGLNLLPEKMLPLIEWLNHLGVDAFNLTLHGHGTPEKKLPPAPKSRMEAMQQVTHALWLEETRCAYQTVKAHAQQQENPLLLVGFSLGAVLGLELFSFEKQPFDQMILLAPPLVIHARGYAVKWLRGFPRLVLKSLAPKDYRANDGTPVAAYLALFQSMSHVQSLLPAMNIPTQIFIDPQDPLVKAKALPLLLSKHHLTQWELSHVHGDVQGASRCNSAHLILDENSLGKNAWKRMQEEIQAHWQWGISQA